MSANDRIASLNVAPPVVLTTWRNRSLIVGIVFALVGIVGFIVSPQQALYSYLAAFMLALGLSVGSMAWLMVWHLTGGSWGVPVRRILEAAIATLPMLIVAWIPIAIGVHKIYPWTHAAERATEMTAHQAIRWLSVGSWVFRGILYFAAWSLIAWFLLRLSHEQDSPPEKAFGPRLRGISGLGLVIWAWIVTVATVDWVMSLTPDWTSTIYGLIFMVGEGLVAMCLVVIISHWLRAYEPLRDLIDAHNFHDYGKLMLTFVMLWAYFSFSQWLIIWAGNIPEETHWFMDRIQGDWGYVSFVLILAHFALPFSLLLSRPLKRDSGKLFWVAVWLVVIRWLDLYWNISPALHKEHLHFSWIDPVMPIALVGLWLAFFFWNLARRPMIALYDPHVPVFLEAKHE